MQPMLNIAIRAARRAGTIISRAQNRLYDLKVESKGHNDYVTQTDVEAEAAIIEVLSEAYPSHSIVAEESGSIGASEFKWVIDPIDGTLNFIHGFPSYAISIALQVKGRLEQAVVYDPTRDELYTASRGAGAQLNGQRIRVSSRTELDSSILGTGFPVRNKDNLPNYLRGFTTLLNKSVDMRCTGSASLNLAYVATGRLDGFWEFNLHEWNIAAGALLVQESGGLIGDPQGGETHMQTGHVIAANPKIFRQILTALRAS
jgi:myo-inositol-1(or 4)-monophosphatase